MAGKIFGVITLFSIICAAFTNNLSALSNAVFDGAARAVDLTLGLLSMMCLWGGILEILKASGAIEKCAKLIAPLLKFLFPTAYKTQNGLNEVCASIAANILGVSNAATPFAVSAIQRMKEDNPYPDEASDDMITLALINCSPLGIMPMTLITLRTLANSASPNAVIVPIWISSALGSLIAVLSARSCAYIFKKRKRRQKDKNITCKA